MIYFDEQTQDHVWARFAAALAPGGALYIGHSERVADSAAPSTSDGLTIYRLARGRAHEAGPGSGRRRLRPPCAA